MDPGVGGIVNDPVLLHVAEGQWWMQLADSDAGLYALGVAAGRFDADVTLPDVHLVTSADVDAHVGRVVGRSHERRETAREPGPAQGALP